MTQNMRKSVPKQKGTGAQRGTAALTMTKDGTGPLRHDPGAAEAIRCHPILLATAKWRLWMKELSQMTSTGQPCTAAAQLTLKHLMSCS